MSEHDGQRKAYQDINAETIDRWIAEGWEWGKPISHETYEQATRGTWDVFLTPTKPSEDERFAKFQDLGTRA